jgi:hypothetical protein
MIWGDDVDPALRPVLGVSLVSSMAASAIWSFMAIWAVEELGAKRELPFAPSLAPCSRVSAASVAFGLLGDSPDSAASRKTRDTMIAPTTALGGTERRWLPVRTRRSKGAALRRNRVR